MLHQGAEGAAPKGGLGGKALRLQKRKSGGAKKKQKK